MHLPGGDGDGPDGAVVVVMGLADGGGEPAHADAVAAHDRVLAFPGGVHIGHVHGAGVFGSQLEDVAHLNAPGNGQGLFAAAGTDAALPGLGQVEVGDGAEVPLQVEAAVMEAGLIGAADQGRGALQRAVKEHGLAGGIQLIGPDVARRQAALRRNVGNVNSLAQIVGELGLVDIHIAPEEDDNIFIRQVLLIDHGLAGLGRRNLQEIRHLLDGGEARGGRQLQRLRRLVGSRLHDVFRGLHVGPVVALAADDQGVLADGGQQHEFMGEAAAHHAGIGGHGDDLRHAGPGKDPLIGLVAAVIILFQILLGGVEGIGVLHGKFADADQAGPGTGLVPELGLNLIDHEGILGVAFGVIAHQLHRRLLVGHAQHHGNVVAVRKAQELVAHRFEPAGFLPEGAGQNDGEQNLLAVDPVHLFPDNLLDFLGNAAGGQVQGKDAVGHRLDVAAPDHQGMAVGYTIGGPLLKAFAHKIS